MRLFRHLPCILEGDSMVAPLQELHKLEQRFGKSFVLLDVLLQFPHRCVFQSGDPPAPGWVDWSIDLGLPISMHNLW